MMKTNLLASAVVGFTLFTALTYSARAEESKEIDISFTQEPGLEFNPARSLSLALRTAARQGRIQEVQRLITAKADVNGSAEYGETALTYASQFNHPNVVDVLIGAGADVNKATSSEFTPLHFAAKYCAPEVASSLIKADANVNSVSHEGRTALIYASQFGCDRVVLPLLRARGIDVNYMDYDGKTALDYASEEANAEVAGGPAIRVMQMLKAMGAKSRFYVDLGAAQPKSQPRLK
jgi:hypothetical protein